MSATIRPNNIEAFKKKIWTHYLAHGRHDLPWRTKTSAYRILISEMMLQQTQVSRVIPKFKEFMRTFPTSAVLGAWQGLGYNRRAKFLHATAKISQGRYPKTVAGLVQLPGIGINTAGAIMAYAYNLQAIFIETNIRRSFIHEFFKGRRDVADKDLMPYIAAAVAHEKNPREWYWALMDYGSMLGRDATLANPNRQSRHYTVQSKFEGSRRQVRGKILKHLLKSQKPESLPRISKALEIDEATLSSVIISLVDEELLTKNGLRYSIY
jgi:A/G-specific adenine glycosylase